MGHLNLATSKFDILGSRGGLVHKKMAKLNGNKKAKDKANEA